MRMVVVNVQSRAWRSCRLKEKKGRQMMLWRWWNKKTKKRAAAAIGAIYELSTSSCMIWIWFCSFLISKPWSIRASDQINSQSLSLGDISWLKSSWKLHAVDVKKNKMLFVGLILRDLKLHHLFGLAAAQALQMVGLAEPSLIQFWALMCIESRFLQQNF